MNIVLYRPVKPLSLNQGFGSNPEYYAKFHDSLGQPLKGHDGLDMAASHGQPVYAAHDGLAQYKLDEHGGDGVFITTTTPYDYTGAQSYFTTCYWHLCSASDTAFKPLIPTNGGRYPVKAGDLIGYADNTGAPFESSGDHLHFGLYPCDEIGTPLNPANGFSGYIDPTPYLSVDYAIDVHKALQIIDASVPVINEAAQVPSLRTQLMALVQNLSQLITKYFSR